MIKIKVYATMAATVLALAACTSDEETAQTDGQPLGAVTVSATIGSPLTRVNTEGDGGTFTPGDIIYVENVGDGKVAGRDKGRYILQADGTTWQPCDEEGNVNNSLSVLWGEGETNRLRGVYPATAADGFTLPTDQSTEKLLRSADYMTCEDTEQYAMPQGGAASLSFGHRMAKLTLRLTLNSQYTGSETIDDVKLYLTDGTTAITPYPTETASDGTRVYTAILNPAAYAESSLLCTLTVDGTPLTARVPSGGITLKEGKAHTLNLRVGKNKIEMGTMTVNEWGSTVGLEDKVAEEQPCVSTTTHTIRTIAEGQIAANTGWIAEAIGDGTTLIITGPMNTDDLTAIKTYLAGLSDTVIDLDLSDAGLTAIPAETFYGRYIAGYLDQRIKSLGQVSLPITLSEIGKTAFRDCPSFTIANWNELTSLTTIGVGAFMSSGLDGDITLPENIKTIEQQAFYQTNITSIVFPSSITAIGMQMLYMCYSLKKVVFKGDITSVEEMVFGGCSALEEIDFSACTTMPTPNNPFSGVSTANINKIKLIVDKDLVSAFEANSVWGQCQIVEAVAAE